MIQGFEGSALYPEYWTDPAIAICPSDARTAAGNAGFGNDRLPPSTGSFIDNDDYSAEISRVGGLSDGSENAKRCLDMKLSMPISYIYAPYATSTISQLLHMQEICAWYYDGMWGPGEIVVAPGALDAYGCVDFGYSYFPANSSGAGFKREDAQVNDWAWDNRWDDDGVSKLPTTYYRLREGIERFFITDINNPAGSAMGQSSIPIMWDSWTAKTLWSGSSAAVSFYNHVPGGSNVLFMDGHTRFIKYNEDFPVLQLGDGNTEFGATDIPYGEVANHLTFMWGGYE
jgi:prepilin-type processing-associated H-X9-DG protein